jgi:hypothetical protein
VFKKLNMMRQPDIANVHCLCRDNVTSHGKNERVDATDAPNPNSTSSEGSAQQRRVFTEVNNEK